MLNDSRKAKQDHAEIAAIRTLHKESPAYGYRRVALALGFSPNKAHRLMKKAGITSRIRRPKIRRYSSANGRGVVVANLLKRNFDCDGPNQKLHCDISYVKTKSGSTNYLCALPDAWNNEIVSWCLANRMDNDLVMSVLQDAGERRGTALQNAIVQTDRGTHFVSKEWHLNLGKLGLQPSMSRPGTPADNAPVESFFSIYKTEYLAIKEPESVQELRTQTESWMEYYNNRRIATKLGGSPVAYRKQRQSNGILAPP